MKTPRCILLVSLGIAAIGTSVRGAEREDPAWAGAQDPVAHNPRMTTFFSYALKLCETNAHPERLEKLLELSLQMQDRDPQSKNFGSFRWNWNDKGVTDQNAIEFTMQPAAVIWLKYRDSMPPAARKKLHEILDPAAVVAALRHHVPPSYTNVAVMSAGNLIVLGEGLGKPEVADEGYQRLQAIFELTARTGIPEYFSPSYYGTDLGALQHMVAYVQRPSGQKQVRALLEWIWTEIAASYWWANQRLCGPHSRDYDWLHGQGGLDGHLAAAGFLDRSQDRDRDAGRANWQPPPALVEMSKSKLPRLVRRQWGWGNRQTVTPTIADADRGVKTNGANWASYTHWLAKDVTLGSGGSIYGPIDVPMAVDFPGSRDEVRCYFVADGRHDPYGQIKIPWRGHPKAVHFQPFFASAQLTQDVVALIAYRDEDLLPGTKTLESHWVMPRAVDAIHVGERKVDFSASAPQSVGVPVGESVFLRQGTAAVAVRVPVARTLAGETAPVALAWDGNRHGAIRLTIDHRMTTQPAKASAAAALQVRVGSGLDEAAFAEFRRVFTAEKCEVVVSGERISIQAPAIEKGRSVVVAASAPWLKPELLEPAASSANLEIDGVDVGKQIFARARETTAQNSR